MKKNNVRSDLEWFETIRECRSSGLSERKWCEANGISHNSLHYYIKKLRGRGYDIPQPSRVSGNGPRQEIVPLAVRSGSDGLAGGDPTAPGGGTVAANVFVGNVRIDFHDGASAATIRNILYTLGGLSC